MTVVVAALLLLVTAPSPPPGEPGPFEVVTRTGEILAVAELADTPAGYLLRTAGGGLRLAPDSLDFYATFRRNLEQGRAGNVLWFQSGRWLRFEKIEFGDPGRVRLDLGEKSHVELPLGVIDFRATVLESGPTVLPPGRGGLLVARSTGPPPPERPPEPEPVDDSTGGAESPDEGGVREDAKPPSRDLGQSGLRRRRLGDR